MSRRGQWQSIGQAWQSDPGKEQADADSFPHEHQRRRLRDLMIIRIRQFYDEKTALEAAGLGER
jgi:hypothetical protein